MEILLAKEILELEEHELESILMKLKIEDRDAYEKLQELIEDL
jgi:hypothetical protein|tara:strand:+ start:15 stop:143 length:129 start_codon:yes stop_codon:yes gene_type:complete